MIKNIVSFKLSLLLVSVLFLQNSCVQEKSEVPDSPQWHLPEGVKVRLGKGLINEIAYSPDGNRLAVASSIGIWIYDAHTGEELALLTGHTRNVRSIAFSPDGGTLASGSKDEIRLQDAMTGAHKRTLTGHTDWVISLAFSSDGEMLASRSRDNTIRLWDATTGIHKETLTEHIGLLGNVAFSPGWGHPC